MINTLGIQCKLIAKHNCKYCSERGQNFIKSMRVKLKNCYMMCKGCDKYILGSIRAVNSWRGENSKDDDTTKTLKKIGLNIKRIREALEKIDKGLKEFFAKKKNNPFDDHAAEVKYEFESDISFYHILLYSTKNSAHASLCPFKEQVGSWTCNFNCVTCTVK